MGKKEYFKESYMGYEINCSDTKPCYLGILNAIFERIQLAKESYSKPVGFHLRLRLEEGVSPRDVTDRLNKLYCLPSKHRRTQNTFKPIWVRTLEHDPDDDGYHYHFAIILDSRKATMGSLHHFVAKMKKKGFIASHKLVTPYNPRFKRGVPLWTEEGVQEYFYWLSYIAKSRTKEFIPETFRASRLSRAA